MTKKPLARFLKNFILLIVFGFGVFVGGLKYDENDGREYLKKINTEIQSKTTESVIAAWAYESNITDENLQHQLDVSANLANFTKEIWQETIKYPWKSFKDPDLRRQFQKLSVLGTAVLSPEKYEEYNKIVSDMQSNYGKAKICNYHNRTDCSLQLEPDLTEIFAESRDPNELRYYWEEWRNAAGRPVRNLYKKYVELSNEAAVKNNFSNTAEFWLKDYESPDFKEQLEDLWQQVKPLYLQLHAYVRKRLREQYGENIVPRNGPIPAHLLGNMWAQSWGNVYNFTVPYPGKASMDVTENMVKQGYTPMRMFKLAEEFFTSLDLSPMPETFWNNSILEKPNDGRDLICHASAWDFYDGKDFRIKQCTRINMEDLSTVHHEMGHIQYFLQYKNQPLVFKEGTNPGFHEAIGDVMALSVSTPKHLKKIGLLEQTDDDEESDINQLYTMALDKIAFLPFGYLMDQWRWSVFEGKTTEKDYNCKWWQLREKYQGLSPSVTRSENDFDPGCKYHTIANVPYIRYFVSFIIQFQFHRALCTAANEYDPSNPSLKPLHQCDIYQSKEAGALLKKMLKMGSSKPWPEAMEVLTGQRRMDASALLDYFGTLKAWLEKENARTGETVGWETSDQAYQCQAQRSVTPSSFSEGNLEGDNLAYSYAEFVQQDDNSFAIPDFMEEMKPYHTLLNHLGENKDQKNLFWPGTHLNDYPMIQSKMYLPRDSLESSKNNEKIIDMHELEEIQKKLQSQNIQGAQVDTNMNALNEIKLKKQSLKEPFEIRSKYNEIERSKILNAILKDLQHLKSNKMSHSGKSSKGKRDWLDSEENDLISKRKILHKSGSKSTDEKLSGEKSDNSDQFDQRLEDKYDFKLKEKSLPLLSLMGAGLPRAKDDQRFGILNEAQDDMQGSTASLSKVSFPLSKGSPSECILDTSKIMNEKHSEVQNANNDILMKAEMVKKGAEQVLSHFNASNFEAKIPNLNLNLNGLDNQNFPLQLPNPEKARMTIPYQKARNPLPINLNHRFRYAKLAKKAKIHLNAYEKLMRDSGYEAMKSRLALKDNPLALPLKEYDLINVIPIGDASSSSSTKSIKESVDKKRKVQADSGTAANQFVVLLGKLSENNPPVENVPLNGKGYVKKSYKEYHYNARTPVVYNSVVISSGGKMEKQEENRDSLTGLSAGSKFKTDSDLEENKGNDNKVDDLYLNTNENDEASLNDLLSKSVRRKQELSGKVRIIGEGDARRSGLTDSAPDSTCKGKNEKDHYRRAFLVSRKKLENFIPLV